VNPSMASGSISQTTDRATNETRPTRPVQATARERACSMSDISGAPCLTSFVRCFDDVSHPSFDCNVAYLR
jgi:hypothetical protein